MTQSFRRIMNRAVVPLRGAGHTAKRQFSTNHPQRFLSRIQWPFVRKPEPLRYRMRVIPPPLQKTRSFARRTMKLLVVFGAIYYLLPFSVEFGTDDEQEAGTEDSSLGYGEDDEEASGVFIPLTWPMEVERTYYRGSDPEWQEYIKYGRDVEQQKRSQRSIVMRVREAFTEIPDLARSMGKVDLDRGRYWLNVDFPPGPPPDYEQIGIEITSSFIALAAQTLSQQEYNQLSRWFSVKAAFNSAFSFFQSVTSNVQEIIISASHRNSKQDDFATAPQKTGASMGPVGAMGQIGSPEHDHSSVGAGSKQGNFVNDDENLESDDDVTSQKALQMLADTQQHFKRHFSAPFQEAMSVAPPRGSIVLTGLVECHGERYIATVDVVAAWSLSEEKITAEAIKIRHIQPRKIRPRRGSMPPHGYPPVPPRP